MNLFCMCYWLRATQRSMQIFQFCTNVRDLLRNLTCELHQLAQKPLFRRNRHQLFVSFLVALLMHGAILYIARSGSHPGLKGTLCTFIIISKLFFNCKTWLYNLCLQHLVLCQRPVSLSHHVLFFIQEIVRLNCGVDKDKKKLSTPVPGLPASISFIFTLEQRNAATCLSACSSSLPRRGEKVEQRVLEWISFALRRGKKYSGREQLSVRENVGCYALLQIVSYCSAARVTRLLEAVAGIIFGLLPRNWLQQ